MKNIPVCRAKQCKGWVLRQKCYVISIQGKQLLYTCTFKATIKCIQVQYTNLLGPISEINRDCVKTLKNLGIIDPQKCAYLIQ